MPINPLSNITPSQETISQIMAQIYSFDFVEARKLAEKESNEICKQELLKKINEIALPIEEIWNKLGRLDLYEAQSAFDRLPSGFLKKAVSIKMEKIRPLIEKMQKHLESDSCYEAYETTFDDLHSDPLTVTLLQPSWRLSISRRITEKLLQEHKTIQKTFRVAMELLPKLHGRHFVLWHLGMSLVPHIRSEEHIRLFDSILEALDGDQKADLIRRAERLRNQDASRN